MNPAKAATTNVHIRHSGAVCKGLTLPLEFVRM
jgi:hypothetical protein